MKILIINSGSSSIKYQLMEMPSQQIRCTGIVERIGYSDTIFKYRTDFVELLETEPIKNHKVGLQKIADYLLNPKKGVIKDSKEIKIVAHRVVHGGNTFSRTARITSEVKNKIQQLCALAPLHNPANLEGILMAEHIFSSAKQVAVFDTAFHQTISTKAKKYAIPNEFFEKGIQVYGFHGISHDYVSKKAIAFLKQSESKIITLHLGNGCSVTAVQNGQSIDHSMGFTPSNGLIMGTRSGDVDHGLIFYLVNSLGYSLEDVNTLLLKKSGMLGLTGHGDLRDIQREAEKGNKDCQLAMQMNAYRIKKYIGSYVAAMNGLDALVFTAGIGENSNVLRAMVCEGMEYMGIRLDKSKNRNKSDGVWEINTSDSSVKILVIPTNEELEIARQAHALLNGSHN
ncbi:acetate kinase [Flavobacteriaceae bacterium F89]|uniref:Acetate kinase n=1 Tax=Cerina litoralis TaxID=2874477 RepID=A0AAE3EVN9_9FLAO|nr:acetate kinase [Cerina litoralis]MCG2460492.1 acetate kinase [Cerina litoralis]